MSNLQRKGKDATAVARYVIREYEEAPNDKEGEEEDVLQKSNHHIGVSREYVVRCHRISSHSSDANKKNNSTTAPDTMNTKTFSNGENSWEITETTSHTSTLQRWLRAPMVVAKELFLPIGYPKTVHSGYLEYQCYDSLQGLCSYLRGVLCSAQVLQAAGVGNQEATAWAAALTWAMKDGMGLTSGLVFSYVAAPLFDAHVKEFRLFADFINNVALTCDMLAPYSPSLLLISSASTICKTLCGMSAAATKASITHFFAIQGNMADLNAKEATQETLVSLIGMLLGITLARQLQLLEELSDSTSSRASASLSSSQLIQWTVFLVLTAIHMWANWKGVYLLRLPTLNRERAEIVFQAILANEDDQNKTKDPQSTNDAQQEFLAVKSFSEIEFPSPEAVVESLLTSTWKMVWPGRLDFRARLVDMIAMMIKDDNPNCLLDEPSAKYYVLNVTTNGRIQVCLLRGATHVNELQAFCHAYLLQLHFERYSKNKSNNGLTRDVVRHYGQLLHPLFRAKNKDNKTNQQGTIPARLRDKGWVVEDGRLYLGFPRRRYEWLQGDYENHQNHPNKKNE
ncbi:hypothetical protein ACA910_007236 [Epithemia clementina (nom. ined.)]